MYMLVWDFVVCTCILHKALIRLRGCTFLSRLLLYGHVCYIGLLSDSLDAHACLGFFVCTCMLHKALIRLRGCTCLSGILLYVHVCYIRR